MHVDHPVRPEAPKPGDFRPPIEVILEAQTALEAIRRSWVLKGFLWAIRGPLSNLEISLSELYLYHKNLKSHQTCGSMDPKDTRAR